MYEEIEFCGMCGATFETGRYAECPICGCTELYPDHNEGIRAYNSRKIKRQSNIIKAKDENYEYDFDFVR